MSNIWKVSSVWKMKVSHVLDSHYRRIASFQGIVHIFFKKEGNGPLYI